MDINYELYKVFFHVASSLSFSEASKQLFISQSAVSQSIKTLEKKLGQPLFIRSTKKVQLTPAGEILLKHIEPAMNLIRRGEGQLLEANTLGLGQLHIGASDTICRYFLVPYLKQFHKKFPFRSDQSHKRHFAKLCRLIRTGTRGSDRHQFSKRKIKPFLRSENRFSISTMFLLRTLPIFI